MWQESSGEIIVYILTSIICEKVSLNMENNSLRWLIIKACNEVTSQVQKDCCCFFLFTVQLQQSCIKCEQNNSEKIMIYPVLKSNVQLCFSNIFLNTVKLWSDMFGQM